MISSLVIIHSKQISKAHKVCGFVGIYSASFESDQSLKNVAFKMSSEIIHRGPDDHHIWKHASEPFTMSFRRLSIQDISSNGRQPMESISKRYTISFNGEIYNHLELRKEFFSDKNNWNGHSDTETILMMFEKFGIKDSLQHFTGMFAIAVWDDKKKLITLIRDRFGEKPLYFSVQRKSSKPDIIFGSELKALKRYPKFNSEINMQSIYEFLKFSNIGSSNSIYETVSKVKPGEIVSINPYSCKISHDYYWNLFEEIKNCKANPLDLNASEAKKIVEKQLFKTISNQMISDVPLGAFLSGGIDSTGVLGIMSELSNKRVNTFTIGIEGCTDNDLITSRKIAKIFNTSHHELLLSPENIIGNIKGAMEMYDEPFADSSQIPTLLVSKLAKKT